MSDVMLSDGVYIRLDPEVYFAQARLGSTDLMRLSKSGEGWWWSSVHNPLYEPDDTLAKLEGAAIHAACLEGLAAYEERYSVAPDKAEYPDALHTIPEIKDALAARGVRVSGTSGYTKSDWVDAARIHAPEIQIWDVIVKSHAEASAGRRIISRDTDRMVRTLYITAMESPEIRSLIGLAEQFPSLSELSFFWTDRRGVKRRARFDIFIPRFTGDLKSFGNWAGRDLTYALGDRINAMGYDIQVGDQQEARKLMHALVQAEGERVIHGGTQEERDFLQAICLRGDPWDWFWLWYQKPDSKRGIAPVIFPLHEAWGGPFHRSGYRKAVRAIDTYLALVSRFGLDHFWRRVERTHHTQPIDGHPDEPFITMPHYGWDENPVEGEDEHFAR